MEALRLSSIKDPTSSIQNLHPIQMSKNNPSTSAQFGYGGFQPRPVGP